MWVIARILSPKKSLRGTLGNLIWKWRLILEISHSIESCTPRLPFLELESSIFAGYVFVMNLSKMSIALGCLLYESSNVTSSNLVLHSMLSEYFSHKWKYSCKDSHWNDGSHTGENSFIWTKFEKEFPITWIIKDKWSNSNKKEASFQQNCD